MNANRLKNIKNNFNRKFSSSPTKTKLDLGACALGAYGAIACVSTCVFAYDGIKNINTKYDYRMIAAGALVEIGVSIGFGMFWPITWSAYTYKEYGNKE